MARAMGGVLQLLRPANGGVAAAAVIAGALAAAGPAAFGATLLPLVAVACATAFAFIGAGNSLNDYFDRDIDRKAHPERPLPSGRMKPMTALRASAICFAVSLAGALWISLPAFLLVLTSALVMVAYELRLKALGLPGNAAIGYLSGITFFYGGLVAGNPQATVVLALLAVLATIGREVAKDIEDMAADEGRRTLPQRVGPKRATRVSAAATAAAIVLSPLPFAPLATFGIAYLPAIAAADATFIYAASLLRASPARSQRMSKVGFAFATLAFALGGLLR